MASKRRKSTVNEATVQAFLRSNLHVLEPGLELVDVGAHLPDRHGSDGYLDIRARDSRGYHVVIEVKLERSAAREGLQELAKYIRLMAEQAGLSCSRMRCIVVSADWDELHAAFSALQAAFPCRLTGYRYTLNDDGVPEKFELVLPRPPVVALSLSPYHFMICTREDVAAELQKANVAFASAGIRDFVTFVFDRRIDYLLYFVIQTIAQDMIDQIAKETGTTIESDGSSTKFGRWEYAVFSLLVRGHLRDDVDDASAVTLAKMVMKYPLAEVHKHGRLGQVAKTWSTKDLVLEAIRSAYIDTDTEHPPPPDLLKAVREHHMWDIDM